MISLSDKSEVYQKYKIYFYALMIVISFVVIWSCIKQPPSPEYFKNYPDEFSFDYFYSDEEFVSAIRAILYEGMPKEEIDKIFVSQAGAQTSEHASDESEVRYFYRKVNFSAQLNCLFFQKKGNVSWKFELRFSEQGQLVKFEVPGGKGANALVLFTHPCV